MGKRAGATAGYGELSNTQKFEFLADVAARLLGHVIDADPQAGPKDPNLQTYPAYELGATALPCAYTKTASESAGN
jgi:hypothetical protein